MVSGTPMPWRQVRAVYNQHTIKVYQAYSHTIADKALAYGRFVSPPFNMHRVTWIKPSFLWMMYRSGWGRKDVGQQRILAIDITRDGFDWALSHGCLTHYEPALLDTQAAWRHRIKTSCVLIQWDPERDIFLNQLAYRSIQIGLRDDAVVRYVNEWIVQIADVTPLVGEIYNCLASGDTVGARSLVTREEEYPMSVEMKRQLGASIMGSAILG